MGPVILDHIPFLVDERAAFQQLHVRPDSTAVGEARRLIAEAQMIARPKALYKIAFVEERGDDFVVIEGQRFKSRVLSVNLKDTHRVFAYTATGGMELENWQCQMTDLLASYWADALAEMALRAAASELERHIQQVYGLQALGRMSPGSLADWPIGQQARLFSLLGDTETAIGVRLLPSQLMIPRKSVSGFQFPSEETFASCSLCPRSECPNRRMPYDSKLFERKYRVPA